ncbi:site-specific integrase [Leeuwenhoekiella sp. LLG6367-2.1]|uniref:site-specific integrase n=1 Tax=Leeuwenhoekiella sp. LLG6367-2.1 TaxID=3160833 RepID=UPI0038650324
MNSEKLSVRFVISLAKTNKSGYSPVSCRLTFKKSRKAFATGLAIQPERWNAKKQEAIGRSQEALFLNTQLSFIKEKIRKALLSNQLKGVEFTVNEIFDTYTGKKTKKKEDVINYFKSYLKDQSYLVGKDIKQVTWNKFNYVCSDVEAFIKRKHKKSDIALEELNLQFLSDFEYYLKTVKNQKQVTINKSIQRFRKPIKEAVAKGYLDKDPFLLYKARRTKKEVVFLSVEELNKLEQFEFSQPRLCLVRDLFVFCCYTGLAYLEMSNLKYENLIKGFDGNIWIQMNRQKTDKPLSVPVLPKANEIITKYKNESDYVLPKFSNQKINSYLKEITGILGINKTITHHTARKTFASTVLLYNDVPIEIVSELLGHSSIQITQNYYGKVVQKKVAEAMQRLRENN